PVPSVLGAVPPAAVDAVVAAAGIDDVIAALAIDQVGAAVEGNAVIALAADHVLEGVQAIDADLGTCCQGWADGCPSCGSRQIVSVDTSTTVIGVVVVPDGGHEGVVARIPRQRVGPCATRQRVVAAAAAQDVGQGVAGQRVGTCAAGHIRGV